ncbi:MAG: EAL domain-containing protein [Euzebyales bacterium]|nr:EAL domain-containing protein [Euzebyales bacterium]MBA3621407.1 EAL domain-containing protein [Euzebyales bacterium]
MGRSDIPSALYGIAATLPRSYVSFLGEAWGRPAIPQAEAVPHNADAAALLAAVTDLGITLGPDVITEGVENPAQAKWLGAARCLLAQGFHYAKPMPAGKILAHEG